MSSYQNDAPQEELYTKSVSGTNYIILNRPKALNSLTTPMLTGIGSYLQKWESDSTCKNIIIKSSSKKAFCAGGDVVHLVKNNIVSDIKGLFFFVDEYSINHVMAVTKKPVIAIIDGITMGGGVGASVHFSFRVATENTLLAMPETLIGLFPDVGATFFLPRLGSELGTYLGLTGTRLVGKDVFYSGFATHYVNSKNIPALEKDLANVLSDSLDETNSILEKYAELGPGDYKDSIDYSIAPILQSIERCFKYNTVESIFAALSNETDQKAWAEQTLVTLKKMSPSSLKISLEAFRRGKDLTIKQCLDMEAQIAWKIIQTNDFREGVSELLITKTKKPKFSPNTIYNVDQELTISKYFIDVDSRFNPKFISEIDFYQYPHKKYTLPNQSDINEYINSFVSINRSSEHEINAAKELIVNHFDTLYNHKAGVKEIVWLILSQILLNETANTQNNSRQSKL
ncbi:hypothetical protein BB561_000908 [Smittium simulii]|uniref:3-hydroxyisobutyryl-CoA hydrolase n=1 Tax=Smittium simulii TaxID=133385 RepID=A0A2T9YWV9_9FUNG|nr:hypothetical protein BB561_000908 [Smittium simulii]